jgi:anaphase-promoting complex subunit 8
MYFCVFKSFIFSKIFNREQNRDRPADSRMLIALGVVSQKLGRRSDAEKLFKKAFQVGDLEGNALNHLAK